MKTLKVLLQEVVSGIKAWVNSNFAQESNTVHKTGNETVNGDKYLTGYIRHTLTYDCIQSTAFDVRTDPEANRGRDIFRFWDGDKSSLGSYLGGMSYYQQTDGSSRLQLICFGYPATGDASQQRINFHAYRDGTGSFYPVRNNVNLGTSAYQWNNAFAKTYYAEGVKIKSPSQEVGVIPSNSAVQTIEFRDKNDLQHGYIGLWDYSDGASEIQFNITDKFKDGAKDPTGTASSAFLSFGFKSNSDHFITFSGKVDNSIIPLSNNLYSLGTSTNKWKSFNGVNPGALCFPEGTLSNANTTFNPDLTDWLTDGTGFTITAQVTGWLHIRIQNSTGNFAWVKRASAGDNQTWGIVGNSDTNPYIVDIPLNVPVVQSYTYTLKIKSSRLSAAIFMCLGNV